jgi:cytochrome b561
MTRRTSLKWLHWTTFGLLLWFAAIPRSDLRDGLMATNAVMGGVLMLVCGAWFARYLTGGPLARPGPKMDRTARTVQRVSHHLLYLALIPMIWAGAVAIWPDLPGADAQRYVVAAAVAMVALHALFNFWRHTALRDNALRIMVPRALHSLL